MFNVGSTFGAWTPAAVFPKSDRVSLAIKWTHISSRLTKSTALFTFLHPVSFCVFVFYFYFMYSHSFFGGYPLCELWLHLIVIFGGSIDRSIDLCSVRRSKGSFEIIIPASFLRFEVLSFASTSNNLRFCRLTYFVSCLRHSHFNQLTECREYYHNSWYSNRERSRVQFFKARYGGISVLSNRQNGWIESGKSGESGESLSGQVEYMPKCRL